MTDLSGDLRTISELDAPFPIVTRRGDGAKQQMSPDSRERKAGPHAPRDMYEFDLHIGPLKVKARNFP